MQRVVFFKNDFGPPARMVKLSEGPDVVFLGACRRLEARKRRLRRMSFAPVAHVESPSHVVCSLESYFPVSRDVSATHTRSTRRPAEYSPEATVNLLVTADFNLKDLLGKYLPFYGVHDYWTWFRLGDHTIECEMPSGPQFRDPRANGVILLKPAIGDPTDLKEEDSRFVDQSVASLRIAPGVVYENNKVSYFYLEDRANRPWLSVSPHGGFKFTPPPGLEEILMIADHAARNAALAAYIKEKL